MEALWKRRIDIVLLRAAVSADAVTVCQTYSNTWIDSVSSHVGAHSVNKNVGHHSGEGAKMLLLTRSMGKRSVISRIGDITLRNVYESSILFAHTFVVRRRSLEARGWTFLDAIFRYTVDV